jgi:hypothetical protein
VSTVQLRRYVFEPGRLPAFLDWFPALVPVREQHGFRVLFALADRDGGTFTWAVEHDGDRDAFRAAEQAYNASPERAAVFERFPDGIAEHLVGFAEDALRR